MASILPGSQEEEEQLQQQEENEGLSFVDLMAQTFQKDVADMFQAELMPRGQAISEAMTHLQQAAAQATGESAAEMRAAQAELQRLQSLVASFQQAFQRYVNEGFGPQ